jgi:hypothetical protein
MRSGWNDVARDVLMDRRARERGLLRPGAAEGVLADARAGAPGAGDAVWSLLNLELWQRTFIDGEGVQSLPVPPPAAGTTRIAASPAAAGNRGA